MISGIVTTARGAVISLTVRGPRFGTGRCAARGHGTPRAVCGGGSRRLSGNAAATEQPLTIRHHIVCKFRAKSDLSALALEASVEWSVRQHIHAYAIDNPGVMRHIPSP